MSLVEVVCDVFLLVFFLFSAKVRDFCSEFWDERTYATFSGMSQQTAGEAFWCCGALGSSEAPLMWLSLAFFRSITPYGRTRDVL